MQKDTVQSLQTALNYLTDSRDGYTKGAQTVSRPDFKTVFLQRADARSKYVEEIETAIRAAGGEPDMGGTVMGAMHRNLMSITSAVQDNDEAAIDMIDDGEERLRSTIKEVIEGATLSPENKALMSRIANELKADSKLIERLEELVD